MHKIIRGTEKMKGNASHEGKEEDNRNRLKDCDAEDKCDNVVSLQ